jgi:hypothetical protein
MGREIESRQGIGWQLSKIKTSISDRIFIHQKSKAAQMKIS